MAVASAGDRAVLDRGHVVGAGKSESESQQSDHTVPNANLNKVTATDDYMGLAVGPAAAVFSLSRSAQSRRSGWGRHLPDADVCWKLDRELAQSASRRPCSARTRVPKAALQFGSPILDQHLWK